MEKEFINIDYDISELVDVDDALDEIPTFELAVFRLEKFMYDGMGADFIEDVKEICKDSKSEKKKNLNYTDKEIDDYIETAEFHYNQAKKDIKTGKTKYKLYIDDPAKISLSLRGLKNVLEYIIEFIESSEYIIQNPKADPRIKKFFTKRKVQTAAKHMINVYKNLEGLTRDLKADRDMLYSLYKNFDNIFEFNIKDVSNVEIRDAITKTIGNIRTELVRMSKDEGNFIIKVAKQKGLDVKID